MRGMPLENTFSAHNHNDRILQPIFVKDAHHHQLRSLVPHFLHRRNHHRFTSENNPKVRDGRSRGYRFGRQYIPIHRFRNQVVRTHQ